MTEERHPAARRVGDAARDAYNLTANYSSTHIGHALSPYVLAQSCLPVAGSVRQARNINFLPGGRARGS
jgi:hypothetical protein